MKNLTAEITADSDDHLAMALREVARLIEEGYTHGGDGGDGGSYYFDVKDETHAGYVIAD
jgi:GTPase involved in cell partitioning and DNA repair